MDQTLMRRRLTDARVGRLATVTPDGRPHVVPCCFAVEGLAVDGFVLYSAVDNKPKATLALQRLANLRANPAASLVVDRYSDDWSQLWWVRVDGSARLLVEGAERERALGALAEKYPPYREARPPGTVIAIDVDRWRAWP